LAPQSGGLEDILCPGEALSGWKLLQDVLKDPDRSAQMDVFSKSKWKWYKKIWILKNRKDPPPKVGDPSVRTIWFTPVGKLSLSKNTFSTVPFRMNPVYRLKSPSGY